MARISRTWSTYVLLLFIFVSIACAEAVLGGKASTSRHDVSQMSALEIEEALQDCPLVQAVNKHKIETTPQTSSLVSQFFAVIFPGSPAVNALLATLYISGPPNFLLALCPPNVDPNSLSIMVAFAVGGLLGDTIFHLLPEIFLGEDAPDHARFVMVEPNKNLLLGVAIIVGFMTFVAMDKALRIATGGSGGHDHGHGNSHGEKSGEGTGAAAKSTGAFTGSSDKELRSRKGKKGGDEPAESSSAAASKEASTSIRLSAYLNLIADFTHNITDGLAMSAAFYKSPTLGATTTAAVFFHEIPHEVGDFALLIQSGFSKNKAMGAQFVTAIGAFLGTLIGIAVQESSAASAAAGASGASAVKDTGLAGTGLTWGDMLLPFTAGTFLYVGTVAVIPELLETGEDKRAETWKTVKQFVAIAVGAGIMLGITWT